MTRLPIRVRVAAAFAVTMAAVLAATGYVLYSRLDAHLSRALDRSLQLRAQDLAVLARGPGTPLAGATGTPFVEEGESFAELVDGRGRVLDSTRSLGGAVLLVDDELRRALTETIFVDRIGVPGLDEPARVLATPVSRAGRRLVLVVGVTAEDREETLDSFRTVLLLAGPVALALATLAGYALAGLSLRPVEAMRVRAAEISAETADERLPVPPTGDELERLGRTLNEMLDRLEAAIERERGFVADAGHELRTPLALLRTELELALRHASSPEELREAVRASSEEVERLTALAEDLLLIARSDRGRLPLQLEPLDAAALLKGVASRFEWRAQELNRPLRVEAPDAFRLTGDRLRLEQALGNLVDNALRHGDGKVGLSARAADGMIELHVADEGHGVPPGYLGSAFERFTRADEARTGGGAGLGLSIVRVIAEAHGGTAGLSAAPRGGADAWIALPASAPVS
jgi:heavy metal sensor kinase